MMAAAAPYILNVWVLEYHCETVLRSVEQKSIWGLRNNDPNSILHADGDFPWMLFADFHRASQDQLWQQPKGIHMHPEKKGKDLVWQWEHHYCHLRMEGRNYRNVCFKISWSFMSEPGGGVESRSISKVTYG